VLELQRQAGNRAVTTLMRAPAKPASVTAFVGMNPDAAKKEAAPLKKLLGKNLTVSVDSAALEKELATHAGIANWVMSALPTGSRSFFQAFQIFHLLASFPPSTRDSLAPVIVTFDQAERGVVRLERLILSGHSNGVGLWGDPTSDKRMGGRFVLDKDLKRIADVFPKAAGQVEDVMFSACFSVVAFQHVREAFPNVQTIWGYEEFSPKAGKGSLAHIKSWERATRGGKQLTRIAGRGSSSLWNADTTADGKFVRLDPARIDPREIIGQINSVSGEVKLQFDGDEGLDREFLAMFYGLLQQGLANPRMSAAQLATLAEMRDRVLRLRFWPSVAKRFGDVHAVIIAKGYAASGLPKPDFASLSRKQLRDEIDALKPKGANADVAALLGVYGYLWDLTNTTAIPDTWIG